MSYIKLERNRIQQGAHDPLSRKELAADLCFLLKSWTREGLLQSVWRVQGSPFTLDSRAPHRGISHLEGLIWRFLASWSYLSLIWGARKQKLRLRDTEEILRWSSFPIHSLSKVRIKRKRLALWWELSVPPCPWSNYLFGRFSLHPFLSSNGAFGSSRKSKESTHKSLRTSHSRTCCLGKIYQARTGRFGNDEIRCTFSCIHIHIEALLMLSL